MLTLRDYQEECVAAHFRYFDNHRGNPLIIMPTGSGKSLIIAEFLRRTLSTWPDQRIICLTHVKELIGQNYAKFCAQWVEVLHPAGIYSAGLDRREHDQQIVFAGIQSVWPLLKGEPGRSAVALGRFDLVLVDECHLIPKRGAGRYRQYLEYLRSLNQHLKVIGYTATPYRLDGGMLHVGDDRLFTDVAYEVSVARLISEGWLSPIRTKAPTAQIETDSVTITAGEYNLGQLAESAERNLVDAIDQAVEIARANERKHWLVFGINVEHAELIQVLLRQNGITCECVFGHTPSTERKAAIERAKRGEITALINVGVLTTGFDWPECDLLLVMRPTASQSLYVQMYGRGMRKAHGKEYCLALDYGHNIARHGPLIDIRVSNPIPKDETGEPIDAKVKTCKACREVVPVQARQCFACGYQFPVKKREAKHANKHDTSDPLKERGPELIDVVRVEYSRHVKQLSPDSMRVTYHGAYRSASEWICFDHQGWARQRARRWWTTMRGYDPPPNSVSEALARKSELEDPDMIEVVSDGKYDRIKERHFATDKEDGRRDD